MRFRWTKQIAGVAFAGIGGLLAILGWASMPKTAANPHGQKGATPTYSADISPFVQKNCLECHRKGGIAPFALDSYDQVKKFGPMIKQVVKAGTMPPWFAKENPNEPSVWANSRALPDAEKAKLYNWVDGGMPQGAKSSPAVAPKFDPEWQIGKPDAVFKMPKPYKLPAEGVIDYQYVNVPVNFDEDKYIEAVEVKPGDRTVVHHILVFLEPNNPKKGFRGLSSLIDYFAIFVPGQGSVIYPKGYGRILPKDHHLRFQIHYTTNGKPTTDQSSIAFRFSKEKPKNVVKTASLVNFLFSIPPGAENHAVQAKITVPKELKIVSFLPHMHLRGKAARYEMTPPGGDKKMLLDIPRYDFNWQLQYDYKQPLVVPQGTRLEYTCWFDNSKKNPANPDPTKTVRWGEQTFEEMALGYIVYIEPAP